MQFYYIANGRLYRFSEGATEELASQVLDSYLQKVRDSAKRSEWKHSGEGAAFRGVMEADTDPESRVAAVSSRVFCVGEHRGDVIYSLGIDRTTGVYRKKENAADGIVISSGDTAYMDFDIRGDRMVLTAAFAGESHIGVMDMDSTSLKIYTEGRSFDSQPAWSSTERDVVYFCCAGLPLADESEQGPRTASYAQMMTMMLMQPRPSASRGPTSLCRLDIAHGSMDELLSDDKFDFTHPQSTADGWLYYIKKPYSTGESASTHLGCLADLVMMPFRLLRALFGFLNVFSAKYSGKTLSKSYGTKERDEAQLFIDGNLVNAAEELRANERHGDKNPGIIPRTWELRRMKDGKDELVRRGVVAYRVMADGTLLVSNGSSILRINSDGSEEKLAAAERVTLIK